MTYATLQEYFEDVYGGKGELPDCIKPEESRSSGLGSLIVSLLTPKKRDVVAETFGRMRDVAREERARIEDTITEEFIIKGLDTRPPADEAFANALRFYEERGYTTHAIMAGRQRILQNREGNRVQVKVMTGNNYVAARVRDLT